MLKAPHSRAVSPNGGAPEQEVAEPKPTTTGDPQQPRREPTAAARPLSIAGAFPNPKRLSLAGGVHAMSLLPSAFRIADHHHQQSASTSSVASGVGGGHVNDHASLLSSNHEQREQLPHVDDDEPRIFTQQVTMTTACVATAWWGGGGSSIRIMTRSCVLRLV